MKNLVFQSENQWQVDLVQNILLNEHIRSTPVLAAREYSQIVTGIGQAQIKLYVGDEDAEKAQRLVKRYLNSPQLSLVTDELKEEETALKFNDKNYFRRVMFLSVAGLFSIPIIFNILATYYYLKLLKQPVSERKKTTALVVLILCWIGVAVILNWIINGLLNH